MAETHTHHGEAHESHVGLYLKVALILGIITGVEVAIFYIPALKPILIPTLLILSAAKFFIVVLWFMHLKFDSRVFWRVFFGPLFLAMLVVVGMIIIFKVVPQYRL